MSFSSYIKLLKPTTQAVDFTTANIGGAKTANQALPANVHEIMFRMAVSPDETLTQYGKSFVGNSHSTEALEASRIFLLNALDDWGVNTDTATAQGHSSGDDDGKFVRFAGFDSNGDAIALEALLDGDDIVATANTLTSLQSAELRDQATGALIAAERDILISRGATLLGIIPAGYYCATSEFDIWLPATLNDTTIADNAETAPSGASWSRPRTVASGLSVANSGVLTAGAAQGIWYRWTLPQAAKPRFDIQVVISVYGESFLV